MVKGIKTISIDVDLWAKCQVKTPNISATISFLLQRWLDAEADEYEKSQLHKIKAMLEQEKAARIALEKQIESAQKSKPKILRMIE